MLITKHARYPLCFSNTQIRYSYFLGIIHHSYRYMSNDDYQNNNNACFSCLITYTLKDMKVWFYLWRFKWQCVTYYQKFHNILSAVEHTYSYRSKKSRDIICSVLISFIFDLRADVFLSNTNFREKLSKITKFSRGESAALGQRMSWANRLFSKSMTRKILNFLHEVEKKISVICPSLIEKIGFPFFKKKDLIFKRQKKNFCWKFFSIKIGKL